MRKTIQIFGVILFLVGLGLFCWPYIYHYLFGQQLDREVAQFTQQFAPSARAEMEGETPGLYPELLAAMEQYNAELLVSGQTGLTEPGGFEKSDFSLGDYGVDSQILGYIRIPALELDLPVYMGANDENLSMGAAWYARTSLPIGGESTNTVIAAHTRYHGFEMFRYLPDLKTGDDIYMNNFWGELHYKVCDTAVITPEEISRIVIQEGKELVTLTTCYPYPNNTHRYLVYAARCE